MTVELQFPCWWWYSFSGTAITSKCRLDGLKQHKCILSKFWRVEVYEQDVVRAVLARTLREQSVPHLPPTLYLLPEILDVLWFIDASLRSLPPYSHGYLPSVCFCLYSFLLFYKDTSGIKFRANLTPMWPFLDLEKFGIFYCF